MLDFTNLLISGKMKRTLLNSIDIFSAVYLFQSTAVKKARSKQSDLFMQLKE